MRIMLLAAASAALALPLAPAFAQDGRPGHSQSGRSGHGRDARHVDRQHSARTGNATRRVYGQYDYNRPDPRYGNYRADRYYVTGNQYQPRRLGANDRIYRGGDNRYYCRRNDGTTGLIIGGITGGLLGNAIAPGGSKTIGTLTGGGLGALLGNSIGRGGNNITCR